MTKHTALMTLVLAGCCAVAATAYAALPTPSPVCGGQAGVPDWFAAGVYRGTLGRQTITLQLRRPAEDLEELGAYFYDSRRTDISLRVSRQANTLVLAEVVWGGPDRGLETTGCLTLTKEGTGLVGEWSSPAGQRLAVKLARLDLGRVPLKLINTPAVQNLRREEPLSFLKLNTTWLPVKGGVKEPLTGVVYPRVAGASVGLAGALQDRQLLAAASALDCQAQLGSSGAEGDGFTLDAAVTRLTPHLVSLRESANYYCGGAHPDQFEAGLILERASGKPLSVLAVWPKLSAAQQLQKYLAHYPKAQGKDCRDAVQTGASNLGGDPAFSGWLTTAGLVLVPTFLPHAVAACSEAVTLPYAELRPLADLSSGAFRDLYPR